MTVAKVWRTMDDLLVHCFWFLTFYITLVPDNISDQTKSWPGLEQRVTDGRVDQSQTVGSVPAGFDVCVKSPMNFDWRHFSLNLLKTFFFFLKKLHSVFFKGFLRLKKRKKKLQIFVFLILISGTRLKVHWAKGWPRFTTSPIIITRWGL